MYTNISFQTSNSNENNKKKKSDTEESKRFVKATDIELATRKKKLMFEYNMDKERSERNYVNFTVKKQTEDRPKKDMMAVPMVGERSFEYVTIGQERQKLEKIEFAYLPKQDVKRLQANNGYSFEQHNSFISKYEKRTLYCLNPKN